MIVNKTHHLMGDRFSKTIKWKAFLELLYLLIIVSLKMVTSLIDKIYFLSIMTCIIAGIFFLYHLYLIIFYDLRIVFITRLLKQNFNDDTNHLKLFRKDNQDDMREFSDKLNSLTINLYIINHKDILYTSSIIVSENIRLLMIIQTQRGKEYLYEVLPKNNKTSE